MNIKTISYRRGATLNIGDYEMVRIEVGMDADLVDPEDPDEAFVALKGRVDDLVRAEVSEVRGKMRGRSRG